ncbi:hypothetical protein G7085_13240 [Tessaracoccus sp. HDW20]|uniref:hypothetical protein n=1 Tax=Tessaracoccus coleopterorum TaxID=2714950 RepID=UPI0018D4BD3F|nr:hypothetical protein [Tessaracoccus coleopterorum]NHB85273.1 hypothetical protein [Tessaracoccus coleopterorum]
MTFIIPSTPLAMGAAVVVLIGNGFVVDEATSLMQNGETLLYRLLPAQHGIALVYDESSAATGRALVYHLVVMAVLFAVAAFLFERRDIKA